MRLHVSQPDSPYKTWLLKAILYDCVPLFIPFAGEVDVAVEENEAARNAEDDVARFRDFPCEGAGEDAPETKSNLKNNVPNRGDGGGLIQN